MPEIPVTQDQILVLEGMFDRLKQRVDAQDTELARLKKENGALKDQLKLLEMTAPLPDTQQMRQMQQAPPTQQDHHAWQQRLARDLRRQQAQVDIQKSRLNRVNPGLVPKAVDGTFGGLSADQMIMDDPVHHASDESFKDSILRRHAKQLLK